MPRAAHDDEVSDDELGFTSTTSKRKGRGGKVTETTITKRELNDETGAGGKTLNQPLSALFDAGPDDSNDDDVVRVRVFRSEPREGYVGYVEDMEATQETIKERWGGSTYRLEGLNAKGRIARHRSIVIAGDPLFVGEAFDIQWRRAKGLPPKGAAPNKSLDVGEVIAMMEAREEKLARQMADREEKERRDREERETNRRREEREWQAQREREQREWDERRRIAAEEVEKRRRQDDEDREKRRREDSDRALAQQQQFMTQMLTIIQQSSAQSISFVKETVAARNEQPKSDPSEMLMRGVELALKLKDASEGGAEPDLLTTVVQNLPGMLNAAGNAVGKAVREVKGGGVQPAPAQAQPGGGLTLPPGEVSRKFAAIVHQVSQAGGDPEKALDVVASRILSSMTPQPGAAARGPAPAEPSTEQPARPVVLDTPPAPTQSTTPPPSVTPQVPHKVETSEAVPGVKRMKFSKGK